MTHEPQELSEARELLGKFEAEMSKPEGIVYLSEALALLADARANAESDTVVQICSNVALAYAKRVRAEVELLLSREPSVHWEVVDHWQRVVAEFERSGFQLPSDVAEIRSRLLMGKLQRDVALMSSSERKQLLDQLQSMDEK